MPSCAVRHCGSNHKNTKKSGVILHRFPTANKSLCKIWIAKCKTANINLKNAVMCSKHFAADQYDRDLQSELLNLPAKKRLLKTAEPTLCLPSSKDKSTITTDLRDQRATNRTVRKRVLWHIESLSPKAAISVENTVNGSTSKSPEISETTQQHPEADNLSIVNLKTNIRYLKAELMSANLKLEAAKQQSKKWRKKYLETTKECLENTKSKYETALKHRFTDAQIRCILKNKKKAKKWPKEDVIEALILRFLSKKAFKFIRNKKIPYPGTTTLSKWEKSFECSPGILENALTILKAQPYTNLEKQCVLMFDEMSIDSLTCYDQRSDSLFCPYHKVQLAMIRGLNKNWKQPIYYNFDQQMTKDLLLKLIRETEKIGYQVVACVSDVGDVTVWKALGITRDNSCFKNPHDESRNVWVFADVPHLMKRLRNHFIDRGFVLPSGKTCRKDVVQHLMDTCAGEAELNHKLTQVHLNARGRDRERVKLATQFFSRSVAEGLVKVLKLGEEGAAFQLINDFFDVFNSSIAEDKCNCLKNGFGFNLEKQMRILNEMRDFVSNLRIVGKTNLLPFQTGFLISISSLKGLFNDLQKNGSKYVLTRRLNQDCMEHLFETIRDLGQFYDQPLASELKNRLSLILLGADTECVASSASNVEPEPEVENLISSLLLSNVVNGN